MFYNKILHLMYICLIIFTGCFFNIKANPEHIIQSENATTIDLVKTAHLITSTLPAFSFLLKNYAIKKHNPVLRCNADLITDTLFIIKNILAIIDYPHDAIHYRFFWLIHDCLHFGYTIEELKEHLRNRIIKTEQLQCDTLLEPTFFTIKNFFDSLILPTAQIMANIATTSKDCSLRSNAEGLSSLLRAYSHYKNTATHITSNIYLITIMLNIITIINTLTINEQGFLTNKTATLNTSLNNSEKQQDLTLLGATLPYDPTLQETTRS